MAEWRKAATTLMTPCSHLLAECLYAVTMNVCKQSLLNQHFPCERTHPKGSDEKPPLA